MKIIVLARRTQYENAIVSLVCLAARESVKHLLEKGHDAFSFGSYFWVLENATSSNLEDVFTLPGHGLEIAKEYQHNRAGSRRL